MSDKLRPSRKAFSDLAKSKCTCGHLGDGIGSEHFNTMQPGHGMCVARNCDCTKFSWNGWAGEEDVAQMIAREEVRLR